MNPASNFEINQGNDSQAQIEMRLNQGASWLSKAPVVQSSTTEESSVVRRSKEHSGRRSIARSSKVSTNRNSRIVQFKKLNSEHPSTPTLKQNMVL